MGWVIRRAFLIAAIVVASAFVALATTVSVPDRAVASSPAQVPPVGPVDTDDDPNEVDDGLPDSVLDPEDLIAPTPQTSRPPVPAVQSSTAAVIPQPLVQTQQTAIVQASPQTTTALPLTPPSAAPASAAPPAAGPGVAMTGSCQIVRTQQTVQRTLEQAVIEVRATGPQEVPPVSSPGSAVGRFTFHEASSSLEYFVTNYGFSPNLVTAAHLHRGPVGVNGPIVHFISATGFMQATGRLQLSAADVADLKAGNLYLNLHSQDYPGGYARAQLVFPAPEARIETVEQQVCQPNQIPATVAPARPAVAVTSARGASAVAPPSAGDGGLLPGGSASGFLLFALLLVSTSATALGTMWRRS